MTSTTASASSGRRSEAGTGLLGTVVGGLVFLSLLFFAVQVVLGLHTTSVVTAVAYDAAKAVAGADAGAGDEAVRSATVAARRALGAMGDEVEFAWSREGDEIVLRVRAPRPTVLGDVVRTVRVRREAVR